MSSLIGGQVKSNLAAMGNTTLLPRLAEREGSGPIGAFARGALAQPDVVAPAADAAVTGGGAEAGVTQARKDRLRSTGTAGEVTPLGSGSRSRRLSASKSLLG
jgi:hypothetical protein